ncbi:O-methyltransferase [Nocardiopsis xinjiangensis]|uniref:O-methyltransferase n=1 Tax=Nocardiopsis xinjiangensis TaxID=124285 RepID=UPI000345A314
MSWARTEQTRFEQDALEDPVLAEAHEAGVRSGAAPVDTAAGSALRFLAAATRAHSVVEVGTGCGTSGLWLLRGMAPEGILTTVDVNGAHQDFARGLFSRAGAGAGRARLIRGAASEVLPRLTDGGYDLVLIDADAVSYPFYLEEARRLLRPNGLVVFHNAMAASPEPDGPLRAPDPGETAVREVIRMVREDESMVALLLPVGPGLLAAIRS